jgi:hypothetical protein
MLAGTNPIGMINIAPSDTGELDELRARLDMLRNEPPARIIHKGLNGSSAINITDDQYSIRLRTANGNSTLHVEDVTGKVIYDGPYNTDAEKEKVPAAVRERLKDSMPPEPNAPVEQPTTEPVGPSTLLWTDEPLCIG